VPSEVPNIQPFDLAGFLTRVAPDDSAAMFPPATQGRVQPHGGQPHADNGHAGNGSLANGSPINGRAQAQDDAGLSYDPLQSEWGKEFLYYRASLYLDEKSGAISGQGGHPRTFDAACTLIKGFDFTIAEARPLLREWNRKCVPPWAEHELEHKLEEADRKPDDKPRGYLRDAVRAAAAEAAGPSDDHAGGATDGATATGDKSVGVAPAGAPSGMPCPPGSEDNPHRLARLFVAERYRHADGVAIRFWNDEFHAWDGSAYRPMPRKEVAAEVTRVVEREFDRIYIRSLMLHRMRQTLSGGEGEKAKAKPPSPIPVTTRIVGDVTQALSDITLLTTRACPLQPAWLAPVSVWPAAEVLPARNALIHLPSLINGEPCTRSPTPAFFGSYALDYDFDPAAPQPAEWLNFLEQLWPGDPESIQMLQEWMGYLLTPDTSQQKIMLMIGPRRSGKGTIVRVIRALIGPENVVNPTLSQLATNFGLAPLVGKPAAIITDARISGRTDSAIVIERLLSISGEDSQTLDRKHKEGLTTKLPTRFMLVSNELPKMKDASGALVSRMLFLKLTRSFYGREDTGLFGRLRKELTGILNWAIQGWARLQIRGHFIQPGAADELVSAMEELTSPIKSFLRDCCKLGQGDDADFVTPKSDLYNRWRTWCQAKGVENVGTDGDFGRYLLAAAPDVGASRPRIEGRPTRCYTGIRFLKEYESNDDDAKNGEDKEFGDDLDAF
jgi:putative DNA primase/helicase